MALALFNQEQSSSTNTPANEQVLNSFHFKQHSPVLEQEAFQGELAQLRLQSQQNEQLIEVMPTGMVMLDGDGVVIKINKVAQSLLDEPILGQFWFDVIKRSFQPRADDWHEVSLKDGRRVKLEITPLGNQPGQLIVITDLTETRLLQDKLGQMQRLSSLGRMVSTLAHQIRTPLSAAMLYSANLTNKKLNQQARENFQTKLSSRLHDLEQQVNDMLLFSKSGTEQVVVPVNLVDLIQSSVHSMEAIISKASSTVNINIEQLVKPEYCQVLGNKNALMGAIQNLIHNSLQAMPQNAVIDIQLYQQKQTIYISVKDNGKGINADIADKIFQPFYTSTSRGTGLGLAVVKSVVNAHQGEVRLISKVGEGAHFSISLPQLNNMAAENQPIKNTSQ